MYGSDSDSLFFTTSLQNAVQSYSLKQAKLLDPSHTHPSPPTVFALSPTSRLLLSASSMPPIILLTNIVLGTPPILLSPGCSSSAVVAAAFHPERFSIFLLAFSDGTAAAYNARHLYKDGSKEGKPSSVRSGHVSEIAHIKNLHTVGTKVTTENGIASQDHRSGTGNVSVGDKATGITAIAFVPGFRYVAFSVGSDGKCCLVDFGAQVRGAARKLGSWHTRGPATSLSLISIKKDDFPGGFESSHHAKDRKSVSRGILVAIGLQDGKVLLFDLSGNLRGQQTLDPDGDNIIDVEWQNETYSELLKQRTNGSTLPQGARIRFPRKSLGSILAGGRPVAEEVVALVGESKDDPIFKDEFSPLKERQEKPFAREVVPVASILNHIDLMSPLKAQRTAPVIGRRGSSRKQTSSASSVRTVKRKKPPEGSQLAVSLSCDPRDYNIMTGKAGVETIVGPSSRILPPQPSPRRGGPLAWHRPQFSRNLSSPTDTDVVPTVSVKDFLLPPAVSKGGAIMAHGSNYKSRGEKPQEQSLSADTSVSESSGDVWTDIEAQSRRTSRRSSRKATTSRKPSRLSRILASVEPSPSDLLISEASKDIIIDRAPASLRPSPVNTMPLVAYAPKELPVIPEKYYVGLPITLSPSFESKASNDTIIDWPSPLRTRRDFKIHNDPADPAAPNTTSVIQYNLAAPPEIPSKPQTLRVTMHNSRKTARPSPSKPIEQTGPLPPPPSNQAPSLTAQVSGPSISSPPLPPNPCSCCVLHTQCQPYLIQLQNSLQNSLRDFTEETSKQIAAQKQWFENTIREADEWRTKLEEENRRLRGELARERRGWRVNQL